MQFSGSLRLNIRVRGFCPVFSLIWENPPSTPTTFDKTCQENPRERRGRMGRRGRTELHFPKCPKHPRRARKLIEPFTELWDPRQNLENVAATECDNELFCGCLLPKRKRKKERFSRVYVVDTNIAIICHGLYQNINICITRILDFCT